MKRIRKAIILTFIVLVGIQFIPTTRNQSNEILPSDFLLVTEAPQNISKMIKSACYDCHSNNTIYPWYNKLQPISWFLEDHIQEGKEELNFSTYDEYSKRKKKSKLKSILSQIKDDEMPPSSYKIMHRDANLSKEEKDILMNWISDIRSNL